ncbi:toxin-antitoxin system YwqK family antitoxin [Pedobacter yulinensis]|uniref:hypothetical protein n=1 Tax=Pedobacter yulinensis TaxID=2126353 RepID=UPI0019550659|nr:hypothetical protein [Pedobacter yulinensis]
MNDFFLKTAFHNVLTGKLSDFCGLFIFAVFWSVVFPRYRLWVFVSTALLFIYWKSAHASPVIGLVSDYVFKINRTIDPTDLIALSMLLLAWRFLENGPVFFITNSLVRQLSAFFIALVTVFSFCATSQQRYVQSFDQPQYLLFKSDAPADSGANTKPFEYYQFDSLLVVKVNELYTTRRPVADDDYDKNVTLKDLDREILAGNPAISLPAPGKITSLTINAGQEQHAVRFNGGRLDGKFISTRAGKVVIEGFYKKGIPDSTWTFRDITSKEITKQTFINGERTEVKRFEGTKLLSAETINTRADRKLHKAVQIGLLVLCMAATIFLLIRNYRKTFPARLELRPIGKWLLCLVSPFVIWLLYFGIGVLLNDFTADIFETMATIMFMFSVTCPLMFVAVFWIRLRQPVDPLLYCLLFALAGSIWAAFRTLTVLSIN